MLKRQSRLRRLDNALYEYTPKKGVTLAHADGSYARLLARFAKADVLVLDDSGLAPLNERERRDLLEIIDDRHGSGSTIHHQPARRQALARPTRCPDHRGRGVRSAHPQRSQAGAKRST